MDQLRPLSQPAARAPSRRSRPQLALVEARLRLVHSADGIPDDWRAALEALLGWLGVSADIVPAARAGRLKRFADWTMPGGAVFAPWLGWSAAALQHGGLAHLPQAQFVSSYLLDHPRGAARGGGGLDLVLMSPHPAHCIAEEAGGVPVPRAGVLAAMIRMARAQKRERLAIIVTARQRGAVASRLLAAGRGLTGDGLALDILTLEEALPALIGPRAQWDAVMAMPDHRSTVFMLLAHASGQCRAWPMLWHAGEGARSLRLVTCEAPGEGMTRLPLGAEAMIHSLALILHAAGAGQHAARLHEGWARLRDSGIIAPGHAQSGAPYVTEVADSEFIAILQRDGAASKRPQLPWRALEIDKCARPGSKSPHLRVIVSNRNTPG
ncbi:hypothetical protein [Porphyrobacter sp. AAP82]|uniref:hypothetical protein n=1 Tax=Porphyrobacter sp. AAP82 TaxID=1248917 RepID=UPI0002FFE3CA|nr:hypothetical protein [Porphyrobacter sp. AAP82]